MAEQLEVIDNFSGEFAFLSNFFPSVQTFHHPELGECKTASVEHAYQALKTTDSIEAQQIMLRSTPGQAKRLGQKVTLREHWEDLKEGYMLGLLHCKFGQNADLAGLLLLTGETLLIEGNRWHDNYWGVCTCSGCKRGYGLEGNAQNKLGRLLMEVRRELRWK